VGGDVWREMKGSTRWAEMRRWEGSEGKREEARRRGRRVVKISADIGIEQLASGKAVMRNEREEREDEQNGAVPCGACVYPPLHPCQIPP
jgi:hypothetical protein